MTTLSERTRRLLSGGSVIAVAMGVMNVSTYGYQMVAANLLGPQQYGAFAALMNLLIVVSVGALGLQATAARRIAAEPQHVAQIEDSIMRVTYRASFALGVVMLVLAPVVDRALRLESLPTAIVLAVAAVPLTIVGGQAGTLQGERRWRPLAVLYLAAGLPRLVLGTALLVWQPTEAWALVGVLLGACAPVVVGWWALRHTRRVESPTAEHSGRRILRESVHNSQALFAFFALSNVDIIVARNVLDGHDAGLYAAGLILVKAVLFLPQFVVVVAFPSMATAHERRRALTRSLAVVGLLGVVATLASWLLADVAILFIGGSDYAEISGRLWAFAVLGTLLSMLQLVVYSVLARQGQRSVYLLWTALVAVVGLGLTTSDLGGLLTVVIAVDAVLLVALVAISVHLMRDGAPEPVRASA